jgi:hypothetical protein
MLSMRRPICPLEDNKGLLGWFIRMDLDFPVVSTQ